MDQTQCRGRIPLFSVCTKHEISIHSDTIITFTSRIDLKVVMIATETVMVMAIQYTAVHVSDEVTYMYTIH